MKALEDYVPKKLKPYFENALRDSDGYWFYFTENVSFVSTDCGIVHEDTISQCREQMRYYDLYPDAVIDSEGYRVRQQGG